MAKKNSGPEYDTVFEINAIGRDGGNRRAYRDHNNLPIHNCCCGNIHNHRFNGNYSSYSSPINLNIFNPFTNTNMFIPNNNNLSDHNQDINGVVGPLDFKYNPHINEQINNYYHNHNHNNHNNYNNSDNNFNYSYNNHYNNHHYNYNTNANTNTNNFNTNNTNTNNDDLSWSTTLLLPDLREQPPFDMISLNGDPDMLLPRSEYGCKCDYAPSDTTDGSYPPRNQ